MPDNTRAIEKPQESFRVCLINRDDQRAPRFVNKKIVRLA